MKKLLMLAVAAMAFAIPASASASTVDFTHEGTIITSGFKTVSFKGPAAFAVDGTNQGVHCNNITTSIKLEANGMGTVETFDTNVTNATQCTTTPDGFVAHTVANNLPWTVDTTTGNADTLKITGVDITNNVTHPLTECVIAVRRLTGDFHATIAAGETNNISTLTLSGSGKVHAGGLELGATVSGTVHKEGTTVVGVATT